MKEILSNGSMRSIAQAIEEMKAEQGESFSLEDINLAELERRSGVSRGKLRRLKRNGFQDIPRATKGRKHTVTKLSGYSGIIDSLLKQGTKNSSVVLDRLREAGFEGGATIVKEYIAAHKHLIPAKRQMVAPQGNRGRRYTTKPGEVFQMDWGFTKVLHPDGTEFQVACFAMIYHHCGQRYVEFFPNARPENLFIGMIHAFQYMGMVWPWASIHNGVEAYWKGVLSHNGEPGETFREMQEIGGIFQKLAPFLEEKARSRVALIISPEALHALGRFPTACDLRYNDVVKAFYRALYELNLESDVLYDREEDWSGYDLLVFPQLYCASDGMIERVRRFVENGGSVFASFRSFFTDENLKIRPDRQPHGLTDVFGVRYDRFTKNEKHRWMELLESDRLRFSGVMTIPTGANMRPLQKTDLAKERPGIWAVISRMTS